MADKYWRVSFNVVWYFTGWYSWHVKKIRLGCSLSMGFGSCCGKTRFMESLVQIIYSGSLFVMAELHYLLPLNMSFMSTCLKLKHDRDSLSSRPPV